MLRSVRKQMRGRGSVFGVSHACNRPTEQTDLLHEGEEVLGPPDVAGHRLLLQEVGHLGDCIGMYRIYVQQSQSQRRQTANECPLLPPPLLRTRPRHPRVGRGHLHARLGQPTDQALVLLVELGRVPLLHLGHFARQLAQAPAVRRQKGR